MGRRRRGGGTGDGGADWREGGRSRSLVHLLRLGLAAALQSGTLQVFLVRGRKGLEGARGGSRPPPQAPVCFFVFDKVDHEGLEVQQMNEK